jgi:hypothetical protein
VGGFEVTAPVSRETVSPEASPLNGLPAALSRADLQREGAKWNAVEELILEARTAHGQSFADIAAVLGRSEIACRIKAHRRGIARRYRRRQPKPERTRA